MSTTQDEAAYLAHLQTLVHQAWPKDANTAPHYPHGDVTMSTQLEGQRHPGLDRERMHGGSDRPSIVIARNRSVEGEADRVDHGRLS